MNLKQQVLKFIEKEDLFKPSDHLLLAVSGGLDSMAMLHLIQSMGYKIQVAHINYKLRGKESDLDEQIVEQFCESNAVKLHTYALNKEQIKNLKSGNLQEKARVIRYTFFEEICAKHDLDLICTAHHSDDKIETSLLNIIRGTGLNGITALKAKNGLKRRPLLNSSKAQIKNYVNNHIVPYRQDKSNLSNDYDRNFIRNEVISKIYKRLPRSQSGWKNTIHHLQDEANLLNNLIAQQKEKWISFTHDQLSMGPISKLKDFKGSQSLVFRWLSEYGYNHADVINILVNADNNGARFITKSHEGIIHLDHLLIRPHISKEENKSVEVHIGQNTLPYGTLSIKEVNKFEITSNPNIEYINGSNFTFPLMVRSWIKGDRYQPIGLDGKSKKISDLFTDLKFNKFDKQKTGLLTTHDKIIWIIGQRLDQRFKVTESSNKIYQLIYTPNTP